VKQVKISFNNVKNLFHDYVNSWYCKWREQVIKTSPIL